MFISAHTTYFSGGQFCGTSIIQNINVLYVLTSICTHTQENRYMCSEFFVMQIGLRTWAWVLS